MKPPSKRCFMAIASFAVLPWLVSTPRASAAPQVFWASDPVRPNEAVLLQGADFGKSPIVEIARLDDHPAAATTEKQANPWKRAPALQPSDCSLKFILPADEPMGVFLCRISVGEATSTPIVINAPDIWWMQGDAGESATPGGWLRVFGRSLNFGGESVVRLTRGGGPTVTLKPVDANGFALRCKLPTDLAPGHYTIEAHNGLGADAAWRKAGDVQIKAPVERPAKVFSVLDFYGANAVAEARKSLSKYSPVPDRTEGIQAALRKAKENGGGTVYFPAGRYGVKGDLDIPPRVTLKGEGEGLVVLFWGTGRFNLDGGSEEGLNRQNEPQNIPDTLIHGPEFGIEDMSLYFPLAYKTGIVCDNGFRMHRVRMRVDHYWVLDGSKRPEGVAARIGANCEVTDCDILAKSEGLIPGPYAVVARNRIMAGKTNCPLGGAGQRIVEDNQFVSMYPTAYQNIAGVGRNLYYAHNRHESLEVHQADYSFTFDAGPAAYFGKVKAEQNRVDLADDPTYPNWAPEKSDLWRKAVVVIQSGRGAGQWRYVVGNHGRQWEVDRPFDCPPDDTSLATIVPLNGRALVVGNRFEDASWVNAGFGTAIDVIYSQNSLYRCASLLNYGSAPENEFQPSWYVQYFDNELHEGVTGIETNGFIRNHDRFACPITRCTIHRRATIDADNSGQIQIKGDARDIIVEGCTLRHPASRIRADAPASGLLFRNNSFSPDAEKRYEGDALGAALVLP